LLQEDPSAAAILTSGSAVFSTANADAFALHVLSAVIRANSNEPTIGRVTVLSKNELLVSSKRGSLICDVDGETRVISEGESFRVVISDTVAGQGPAGNGGKNGSGGPPRRAGRSKAVYYIIGATALLTVWALHEALESPDRP